MPQCKALTNQIHYSIDGYYKPCCAFGEHNTDFPIAQYTPAEFQNSEYMTSIKTAMLSGWHSGCNICKQNEQAGSSLRQSYNMWCKQETGTVEFLDISLNNQCNLACRMCSHLSSSKWAELLNVPSPPKNNFKHITDNINISKLIKITYVGGEPFITPEIKQVLEFVVQHQIGFTFDTNCTFYPTKYEHLLKQIPILYASFSIDGIGKVNDYIRHGSNYTNVLENLKKWADFKISRGIKSITTVVQAYNFHDLKNIKQLAKEHKMLWTAQLIENPSEFQINALPPDYVESVKDEVNEKFLSNYKFDPMLYKKLKAKTKQQDMILNKINTLSGVFT